MQSCHHKPTFLDFFFKKEYNCQYCGKLIMFAKKKRIIYRLINFLWCAAPILFLVILKYCPLNDLALDLLFDGLMAAGVLMDFYQWNNAEYIERPKKEEKDLDYPFLFTLYNHNHAD